MRFWKKASPPPCSRVETTMQIALTSVDDRALGRGHAPEF